MKTRLIHPTAVIHRKAKLGKGVAVGPYSTIGENVSIGDFTEIGAHVSMEGPTEIGSHCRFFPFASIGHPPQDLKYSGGPTSLKIGNHNVFREFVTVHRGTEHGGGITSIEDHNYFMAYVHVAHDCHLGNHIILGNAATLAGHVTIGDYATIGAFSGVHQFCRIGPHGFVGGYSVITRDVLPYSKTVSERGTHAYGVNSLGLKRRGLTAEAISRLHHAFHLLLAEKLNTSQALKKLKIEKNLSEEVKILIDFVESSERGVIK
ncbi:MAG: acyl-ACP--UDP-N-acetylglucosamine O-acyltransferase [Acidobacteriia bacterium]|nr:acyl-ACP--UDP-N-acetylglucosamine O-acyltransferase [Terriglobia bacterium]